MGLLFNSKKPEPKKETRYGWPFDGMAEAYDKKQAEKLTPKQKKELARKKWLAEQEEEDFWEDLEWFEEEFL